MPLVNSLDPPIETALTDPTTGRVVERWRAYFLAAGQLLTRRARPFAALPTVPTLGMLVVVSDSTTNTWGAVIAGGGGFTVLAFYNGTQFTVAGK